MSEVQKDPEDVSAGIGQKKKCEVLIKFSCNLRSKSARSTLTSPGSIRVKPNYTTISCLCRKMLTLHTLCNQREMQNLDTVYESHDGFHIHNIGFQNALKENRYLTKSH
jgi:hypothetical protein